MAKPYQALIKGCVNQKPAAQRELYEQFASSMLAVCYRYARDKDDAEDILQEGFVKVFQKIGKFDDRGSLEGWIRKIMVNTAIDHLRKQKYQNHQTELNEGITEEVSADILDHMELEFLFKVIQQLPTGYRLVFNLYAVEGYSHKEIADELGITESTSRSQYTRAKAMLRQQIGEIYMEKNIYKDVI
ncbi:MAG: sigma-70 family RNA polymerase sigma factor [Bacteroidia bacterium]|nr:sigma-70 family RNA polymerase sigma factor [Bacteroidia bacterium]